METLVAQFINGLATGGIYALIVLGMNLLIVVRGVVYFCYANIVVMSMTAGWIVLKYVDNVAIAIPAVILTGIVLAVFTEPLFRPLTRRRAFLETNVLALGIAIIITEILSHFVNNGAPMAFPESMRGGSMMKYGIISYSIADMYTLIGSIVSVICLFYFLFCSKQGRAIRAIAQNVDIARYLGISFKKTGIYGFALAGVLAGVIGVLLIMSLGSASSDLGDSIAVKAMILMLAAGAGNLKGGLISALLMGIAEAMALAYLPGRWTEAIFFGVITIVIIWKPNGLFGARS